MLTAWSSWVLASAFFLALYDIAKKASVRANAVLPVLFFSTLAGGLVFLAVASCAGRAGALLHPTGRVLALAAAKSLIVSSSWVFTFCALRTLPVTIATPIRASAPALVFVAALFLYGETPTWRQGVGMLCVFLGYWAFSRAGLREGIDFRRNRAVWCAAAGAVLSACSSLWDKYVFQVAAAPVQDVQLWFQIGLFVLYGILLAGQRAWERMAAPRRREGTETAGTPFEWRWTIPLTGMLLAAADWLYFNGIAVPDTPISVASLTRRASVVITFVLGAVFFGERNLKRKAVALAVVLAGLALLV